MFLVRIGFKPGVDTECKVLSTKSKGDARVHRELRSRRRVITKIVEKGLTL